MASDDNVNAFRHMEQQAAPRAAPEGQPHPAFLLPFDKSSDGARSMANNAIRSINRSVLHTAVRVLVRSVAILVDHGLASWSACATACSSGRRSTPRCRRRPRGAGVRGTDAGCRGHVADA
uniref:Uncharacterized protein n=1 Tax=Zea mays TaxID=4577 RepID=A0A804MKT6_MAIZE